MTTKGMIDEAILHQIAEERAAYEWRGKTTWDGDTRPAGHVERCKEYARWYISRYLAALHDPAVDEGLSECVEDLRRLHAESPHILDWRTKDGFTIPVLNVCMALANRLPQQPVDEVSDKEANAVIRAFLDDEFARMTSSVPEALRAAGLRIIRGGCDA